MWKHQTFLDSITNHRFTFVCTAREFVSRFGELRNATAEQLTEVESLVVLCKDGMIRPR